MARRRGCGATQAYRGQTDVIKAHAPNALDFTNKRYRHRGVVDEAARAKNRTKSKVRSKVEHAFHVIKRQFGFAKVRYRGLDKNAHRLFVPAPQRVNNAHGFFNCGLGE